MEPPRKCRASRSDGNLAQRERAETRENHIGRERAVDEENRDRQERAAWLDDHGTTERAELTEHIESASRVTGHVAYHERAEYQDDRVRPERNTSEEGYGR